MIKKLTSDDVDYIEQIFNLEKEIFKNSAFNKRWQFIYLYLYYR